MCQSLGTWVCAHVRVMGVSKHVCGVSKHVCGVSKHVCGVSKHVCGVSKHVCGVSKHVCGVSKHLYACTYLLRQSKLASQCLSRTNYFVCI
jgi:hypothetical protein